MLGPAHTQTLREAVGNMGGTKRVKEPEHRDETLGQVLYALIMQALRDTSVWLSTKASSEEKVYVRQAQSRLNDLARICERQRGLNAPPKEDKEWNQAATEVLSVMQKAVDARGSIVGTGLARLLAVLAPPDQQKQPPKRKAEDRHDMIHAFLKRVLEETGVLIRKKDVWLVAGYQDATEFERFQRNARRTTKSAKTNFDRVLNSNSEDFVRLLEARKKQDKQKLG